jgi:hypothetical protein
MKANQNREVIPSGRGRARAVSVAERAAKNVSCAPPHGAHLWRDPSALERKIDQPVSALYGLTPEEIKIVEEATK